MDFNGLVDWKKSLENMPMEHRVVCPNCEGWLETHPRTQEVYCQLCGWPWQKPLSTQG